MAAARGGAWRRGVPLAAAALVAGVVIGAAAYRSWTSATSPVPAEAPRVTRFVVTPPPSSQLTSLAGLDAVISPDGSRIAYFAALDRSGRIALRVRELDSLDAQPVRGAEFADSGEGTPNPFFSPDGRSVGFRLPGQGVMRVALNGGPAVRILDDSRPFIGAAWTTDGHLIFASVDGLYRVSVDGGTPERLTRELSADERNRIYAGPVLLPGERAVLFVVIDGNSGERIGVLDLVTGDQRVLVDGASPGYAPSGHLLFVRDTTLLAAPFDADRLEVTGEAVPVVEDVRHPNVNSAADYAVSSNGTLIYVPGRGATLETADVVWVERSGAAVRAVDTPVERPRDPRLSPDARRLLLTTGAPAFGGLWVYDLAGRPPSPLSDDSDNRLGVWSPDGVQVAFWSLRGPLALHTLPADGSGREPRAIPTGGIDSYPAAWLATDEIIAARSGDIAILNADGTGEVRDVVATPSVEAYPAISPDGRWLAYTSDRTGRPEVWIRPYPDGNPVRVSDSGATEPVWSRDGRELFYRRGSAMMAVAVRTENGLAFDPAVELFAEPYLASGFLTTRSYDVAPDGRFLMIRGDTDADTSSIVVVQNWTQELERRVPVP